MKNTYKMAIEYQQDIATILTLFGDILQLQSIELQKDCLTCVFTSDKELDELLAMFLANIHEDLHYCYRTLNTPEKYDTCEEWWSRM